jgi:hypothetical protein
MVARPHRLTISAIVASSMIPAIEPQVLAVDPKE